MHSGIFSKYLLHPEASSVEGVVWKTDKTLTILSFFFFNNIAICSYKAINLVEKYAKIIKVLSFFLALPLTMHVSGCNE